MGALLLCGCSLYHASPITPAAVDAALAPTPMEAVRVAAQHLHHPILPPIAFDERDGLSPDEAAVLAVLANPRLRVARDERGLAAAQLLQAGLLPNPTLDASLDFPRHAEAPDNFTAQGLSLSWEISALLARPAQIEGAKAHARSIDLDIAWQEWQVAQAARLHVLRLAALRDERALARTLANELAEGLVTLRQAVAAHHTPETELAAAEDALRQAQAERLDLDQEEAAERLDLNEVMGQPPAAAINIAADVGGPTVAPEDAATLFQSAMSNRLDLLALRMGYDSQEAALRAAVRSQFPKIGISLSAARDTANIKTRGLGASIDLPFFDRNQGQIKIETATRKQLYDEYMARLGETRAEIALLASNLAFAHEQWDAAREGVATAQRMADTARAAMEKATVDVLSYYEAQKALSAIKLEVGRRQRDIFELTIALETATGRFFPAAGPSKGK